MSQRKGKEIIAGKELLFVDRILNEYSEAPSGHQLRCVNYIPAVMGAGNSTLDSREPTIAQQTVCYKNM